MVDSFRKKGESETYQMDVREIIRITEDLISNCQKGKISVQKLLSKSKSLYEQWQKLLQKKGEFSIEHTKIKIPIYSHKTMPENVTLYEDVVDQDQRYLFERVLKFYLSSNEFVITTSDVENDISIPRSEGLAAEKELIVIKCLLQHSKELIHYSKVKKS